MADNRIFVPYNRDLKPLEDLVARVERPGDFYVLGAMEIPMPRVEIEGAGVLSFPVQESQVRQIVAKATRAPYGRGNETIVDESVRATWQLLASQLRIGGKSWAGSFQRLMEIVIAGLGCEGFEVTAELHKLLVYDTGDFFTTHRNTEKSAGMFGTLVIVLPSLHRGGELVIRHAERQVTADLNSGEEVSELRFAAFYADCEHEVLPITEGSRVCLIYNLIQQTNTPSDAPLAAPPYSSEIEGAGAMLKDAFADRLPAKLAWLLEHDYTAAGLSFAGLKGQDAARAKVLRAAAERAGCAVHLGIVHIEESGPAEPDYESRYRYRRRSYWQRDEDADEVEDVSSDSFEVVEVSDVSRSIDEWRDAGDQPVDFGKLPLEDGEVLPAGALDEAEPDEQRLMESTGNEGASFERAYHRAALVIWPQERFADVLLQAGVGAVLPHLQHRVRTCMADPNGKSERKALVSLAERIIASWAQRPGDPFNPAIGRAPDRAIMLQILGELGEPRLLTSFLEKVVIRAFDGSENAAVAETIPLLGPARMGDLLTGLVQANMQHSHPACVNLLRRLVLGPGQNLSPGHRTALRKMAAAIVGELPALPSGGTAKAAREWWRVRSAPPADSAMVADLLASLADLKASTLRAAACTALMTNVTAFDPAGMIVPALQLLQERDGSVAQRDLEFHRLWCHAAEFLLRRSEQPPAAPTDWKQRVTLSCKCEDCRGLQTFARDALMETARFSVRKERRQHLHHQIERAGLDMTHVTERRGSPQTLVCTKTRGAYRRQCAQHQSDCASMAVLLGMLPEGPALVHRLAERMAAARNAKPAGPDPL